VGVRPLRISQKSWHNHDEMGERPQTSWHKWLKSGGEERDSLQRNRRVFLPQFERFMPTAKCLTPGFGGLCQISN